MAKITRVTAKVFGSTAGSDEIGEFGSLQNGSPTFTTDPAVIQSQSNYLQGWFGAVIGGNSPAIEDMNAIDFLNSRQIAYLMQSGIPEWDAGTTYFINSFCNFAGAIYVSVTDNNINNNPGTSGSIWHLVAPLSSGGGGSGTGKNYISTYNGNPGNGDFEKNTTAGFTRFNTTLTGVIPTGTIASGAASITTFATTATSPLGAKYSLNIATTSGFVAGDGFISDAFTVDNEDLGKVLTDTFFYQVLSGATTMDFSGTSTNTWAVYFYDVTNAAWIQPNGVYNLTQNQNAAFSLGAYSPPLTSKMYRIAVLCINSGTGAASMLFDDFNVGPQGTLFVPAMSDWRPYSVTITSPGGTNPTTGTVVRNFAFWRRVGSNCEVLYTFSQTAGGTSGSGSYSFSLPPGLTADNSILNDAGGGNGSCGSWVGFSGPSSSTYTGTAYLDANEIQLLHEGPGGSAQQIGSGLCDLSTAMAFSFNVSVPIVGWSSGNTAVSVDSPQLGVCITQATVPSGTQITTGTNAAVIFPNIIFDTTNSYNTSTGIYTAPKSGYLNVQCSGWTDDTAAWIGYLTVNGVEISSIASIGGGPSSGSATVKVKAGDQVSVYSSSGGGIASSVHEIPTYTFTYVDPPASSGTGLLLGRHELQFDEFNNFGSTDTSVIGFVDPPTINVGDSMSYVTNAANGTVVTINFSGLYAMSAATADVAGGTFNSTAITKNASGADLTVSDPVTEIAPSKRLAIANISMISTVKTIVSMARTTWLNAGDKIRVQNSQTGNTLVAGNMFSIVRIA